jgi:hypothetical protein
MSNFSAIGSWGGRGCRNFGDWGVSTLIILSVMYHISIQLEEHKTIIKKKLTASKLQWAALNINREIMEIHRTAGFNGDPGLH